MTGHWNMIDMIYLHARLLRPGRALQCADALPEPGAGIIHAKKRSPVAHAVFGAASSGPGRADVGASRGAVITVAWKPGSRALMEDEWMH
jgi:hypothetical protein